MEDQMGEAATNGPQGTSTGRSPTHEMFGLEGGSNAEPELQSGSGGHEHQDEGSNDHLALIYESQAGQFEAVVPFIKQGLEQGERCLYVADENTEEVVLEALREGGVDADAALSSGALSIHTKATTYLRSGKFEVEEMLELLQEILAEATGEEGYAGVRAAAEMTWALDEGILDRDTTHDESSEEEATPSPLVRYEAMLNRIYSGEDCVALCQYNRERFPAEVLSEVIQAHPLLIYDGTVCRNVHYQPPDEFLGGEHPSLDVTQAITELVSHTRTQRALQQSEKRVRQQEVVADLGQKALEEGDLDRLLADAAKQTADSLGAGYCSILESKADAQKLVLREGVGWKGVKAGEAMVDVEGNSLAAHALRAGEAVVANDLEEDARIDVSELLPGPDVKSGIGTIVGPEDDPWGVVTVFSHKQQAFSGQDAAFVQSVANTLASAIERAEQERYQREFHEITARSTLSFEEKLQALFDLGCEWFGMDFGALNRVDPEADHLQVEYVSGEHPYYKPGFEIPLSQTYCQAAADLKEAASVSDPKEEDYEGTTVYEEFGVEGYFGTYVSVEGGPDRTLAFLPSKSFKEPHSEEDRTRLELMGQWVKYELEREESRRALQRSKDRLASKVADLQRLHALSARLLEEDDVESALHEVMAACAELLGVEKASVQLYDEQEEVLRLVSALGFDQTFFDRFEVVRPDDFTTCAASLEQGGRVLVEDLSSDPEFAEFAQAAAPYGVEAALSTPLYGSEGQLFGVFTMYWEEPHRPSEEELKLLDLYTQQAARQIERKRAAETLREREEYLSALFQATPECIKVVAEDGTLLEMNPAGLDMVEVDSASSVVGDSVYDLIAPEDRERFRVFNERICRGESGTLQFDIIALEGTRRHMESHAAPLHLSGGDTVQVALTRDITQQKRREERLRDLNETLEERVEKRTRQVRALTSQVTLAEQRERERIGNLLHDDLQQRLYGSRLQISSLRERLLGEGQQGHAGEAGEIEEQIDEIIQALRRLSVGMSPPVLKSEGLTAALEWLQSHMAKTRELSVELKAEEEFHLRQEMRVLLFQVVRELLSNVDEHAGTREAFVGLWEEEGGLLIQVSDEGKGFDPGTLESLDPEEGFGLSAARERLRLFGGDLEVQAAQGEGTEVTIWMPLEKSPEVSSDVLSGNRRSAENRENKSGETEDGETKGGEAEKEENEGGSEEERS